MPRALLITFHYPPSNTSSGGLRPLKFGKYLPEFGWSSSVLTVPMHCYDSVDLGMLEQIPPGVRVHRARCYDVKKALAIRGRYPGFLAVPDRYLSWLPFAVRRGMRIIREEGVRTLYSTSPIPTSHLIAVALKRLTGLPWVADFRDPWVETEGSEVYGPVRQTVELWLERLVVGYADRVLTTTRELGDYLRQRYGNGAGAKIEAIYNGYDEDDFAGAGHGAHDSSRFSVVHAGLLDPSYRNPIPFLHAVRRCIDDSDLPADVVVRLIGAADSSCRPDVEAAVRRLRLDDVVQISGRVPYREALDALSGAGALLLLQGGDDTRALIPAKAYEYLRSGRLVLALAPAESATIGLVSDFPGTFTAEIDDVDRIARALTATYGAWAQQQRTYDRSSGLRQYSRRAGARQLAAALDALVPGNTDATARDGAAGAAIGC